METNGLKNDPFNLAEAFRLASKYGPEGLGGLMAGWRAGLDREVVEAAHRGDEAAVKKLLGVKKGALQVGGRMLDGTIYLGNSPDSGKALYAAAADTPFMFTFVLAASYAENLVACGHKDWRLPTQNELKLMFNHRDAIGGFDTARGSGDYCSGTFHPGDPYFVKAVTFSEGNDKWLPKDCICMSVRLVRAEP
jgi:hypothetical protein